MQYYIKLQRKLFLMEWSLIVYLSHYFLHLSTLILLLSDELLEQQASALKRKKKLRKKLKSFEDNFTKKTGRYK